MNVSETLLLILTAVGSLATAGATIMLVIVGWRTLSSAGEQLRSLREQVERDARPYVVLSVVTGLHGVGAWDLVVTNGGRSIARGVVIDLGELIPINDDDHIVEPLKNFARTPRDIVPGERLRVMWSLDDSSINAGVAGPVEAIVSYNDDLKGRYSEKRQLVSDIAGAAPAPSEGPIASGGESKDLRNINHALRTLNMHIGELRR